jgi:hypothetical protein
MTCQGSLRFRFLPSRLRWLPLLVFLGMETAEAAAARARSLCERKSPATEKGAQL